MSVIIFHTKETTHMLFVIAWQCNYQLLPPQSYHMHVYMSDNSVQESALFHLQDKYTVSPVHYNSI